MRSLMAVVVLMIASAPALVAAQETPAVTSRGFGVSDTQEDATEVALTDAVRRATGTMIFSRSVASFDVGGNTERTKTVGVVNGFAESYEVVSVEDAGRTGKVQVTVEAVVIPQHPVGQYNESEAPKLQTWISEAARVASIPEAQRKLREYQRVLDGYVGNAFDQLQAGYFIAPRQYVIDMVNTDSVEGRVLIDIIVNETYWKTYYAMLDAMNPVNSSQVVVEGPLDDSKGVSPDQSVTVDKALQDGLAQPIPLTIGFKNPLDDDDGVSPPASLLLYKNAVFRNHDRVGNGLQRGSIPREYDWESPIAEDASDLRCDVEGRYQRLYTCGKRITVELAFEVATEKQARLLFEHGVAIGISR